MDRLTYAVAVKRFLELDAKPVSTAELMLFWKSCSTEEKKDFAECAGRALGVEVVPA